MGRFSRYIVAYFPIVFYFSVEIDIFSCNILKKNPPLIGRKFLKGGMGCEQNS